MAKNREDHSEGEAVLLLNKGKRGLLRMIFGRTMVIILLLVLQVVLLAAAFLRLGEYYYGFAALAALMVSLAVVNRRRQNPAMKITWILLIMAAPVFAIPLYFFVDAELGHRVAHHRLQIILEQTAPVRAAPAGAAGPAGGGGPGGGLSGGLCGAHLPPERLRRLRRSVLPLRGGGF